MGILPHFLLAGALFLNDLPCVQKNWIFPLKDVRLKTPLDNNQTGPSGRLIVVEGVVKRTSYKISKSKLIVSNVITRLNCDECLGNIK